MPDKPLKLFRATDFVTSTLMPGETRLLLHPGWMVLGVSAWIALACNVALWRALAHPSVAGLAQAGFLALLVGTTCTALLSLLDWRAVRKPLAVALLLAAAWIAVRCWQLGLAFDARVWRHAALWQPPSAADRQGWSAPALLVVLGGLPSLWVWRVPLLRLGTREQWAANFQALVWTVIVLVALGFVEIFEVLPR